MYAKTSMDFDNAINSYSRTFRAKIIVDSAEITEGIHNIKWIGGSSSEDVLTLGSTVATRVEIEMVPPSFFIENKEIEVLIGLQLSDDIEYIPMGLFTVEHPEKTKDKIKFIAHDRMISKGEKTYFSGLSFPNNSVDVLNEVCGKMGISLATTGLNPITINSKPEGYTCREIIGYIAGLYGCFANINRDGNLELNWYKQAYSINFNRATEPEISEYDYVVHKIECAVDKETVLNVGSELTGIQLSNPFMTQNVLESIFEELEGFAYRPCSVELLLGDPRLDPWDMLSVTFDGESYLVPCMELTHNFDGGVSTEIKVSGESEIEAEYSYKGPTTQAIDRMYTELLLVKDLVADKITVEYLEANFAKIDDLKVINAQISDLKANQITTDYLKANFAEIDLANIKDGCITTAMIGVGVIGTTQIADGSITDAKIVGLTANKITAGRLDASEIEVVNLNAANITVGTINGQQIAPGAINLDKLGQDVAGKITEIEADVSIAQSIADAAQTLASAANNAANAAQASANGKNTIFYQASAPSTSGRKTNDIWFDTDDGNKMYYYNGTAWTAKQFGTNAIANLAITNALIADATIQSAKIANLDAGKITTGTLNAARIAAGSITGDKIAAATIMADRIALGDFTNYVELNSDTATKRDFQIVEDSATPKNPWLKLNTIARDRNISRTYTCSGGEKFRVKAEISTDVKGASTSSGTSIDYRAVSIIFIVDKADGTRAYLTSSSVINSTGNISSVVTLPDTARKFYITLHTEGYAPFSGSIKVRNVSVTKMSSAELIVDGSVTAAKIAAGTITATQIAVNTITGDKIAAGAITATQIAANAITSDKIVADAITTAKIATGAVTANEIAAGTITAAKIASGTITATQLAAGAVTAVKIAAGTITATQIAANAITAEKIASKAITADKISVTDLYAIGAKIGGMVIANDKVYGEVTSGSTVWGSGIAPYKQNQYSLWVGETNQAKGTATTNAPFKVSQNGTVWADKLYAGNSMDFYDNTATWKGDLLNIFREDGTLKIKQNHHENGKTILMLDQAGGEAQLVFNYAGSPHGTVYFYSGYNSSTYVGMYHKERNNGAGGVIWRYHTDGKFHIEAATVAAAIQCTTLTQTSTIRAKRDWKVVKPGSALQAIKNTQVYTYKLNGHEELGEQMGLIIEKGCPKEVITPDGGAVNLYSFISLVANAVRELAAQVDMQSNTIDVLAKMLKNNIITGGAVCTK